MSSPGAAYARLDARLRTARIVAIVLGVVSLSAAAYAAVAAGHFLGLQPSSPLLRRGEAVVRECQADASQFGLMQRCPATVTWEPESKRARKGMRDKAEVVVEARRAVSGRVAVESYEDTWSIGTSNMPDTEVVMVAGDHRRAGEGVAALCVLGALAVPVVVTGVASRALGAAARRDAARAVEGEGSEPRGRRIA
ncbi:hypothetical protein [Mariniluteicoccus flavus]